MEGLLPLLRLRFSYCLASRLDTCQNSYSGRLNGSRASINGTGLRCVKNDFYAISIFRYKSSPLCRVIFKCSVRVLCVVPSGRLIAPGDPASDVGERPNITGWVSHLTTGLLSGDEPSASGSFSLDATSVSGGRGGDQLWRINGLSFSARNINAVYGASSTVQPASVCFLACIKI